MAAVRLIALHANKGRTISQTLNDRTDYAKNPEKTEKGELVTAYGCDPITVDEEFMLQKRLYYQVTGRSIICSAIDTILAGKPKDFEAFVRALKMRDMQ